MGDLWLDSGIHQVFLYLYGCKHCKTLHCIYIDHILAGFKLPPLNPALAKDPGVVAGCHEQIPRPGQRQCVLSASTTAAGARF